MLNGMRNGRPNRIFLTFALFVGLFLMASVFIGESEKSINRKIMRGYINDTDSRNYYNNIVRLAPLDPSWLPEYSKDVENQEMIAGESGIIVDMDTNKVVYAKNPDKKMKIASLTKVMTAVVALEHINPEDRIIISSKAASIGENSMGLSAGEEYTLKELLYGLILPSGNDAAYAIAEGTSGDVETFVLWMNIKSAELGMHDTSFYDPSGLDDRTTSTPLDLIKLTRYAINSVDLRNIAKTTEIELISDTHKYIYLENQTNLLRTYPGVSGLKTGYTEEAGLCLITTASYENHDVMGVVLNSIDRKGDMILMLDYAYSQYGLKVNHGLL